MPTAYDYAVTHHDAFCDQLVDWLRIPSVSTDPQYKADVKRAAEWLADDMRRIGLENVAIMPTDGHPVVYGEWLHAGDYAPTVLIYGHYDVQPAVVEDGWAHHPFEPQVREGKIFGRGATDDKGQVMIQLKAAEALLKSGACEVNLKYIIEGEEEIGSPNLARFLEEHVDLLRADICLISDTAIQSFDQPALVYGLRGLLTMQLTVSGPRVDLHSGTGGIIHNPIQALSEILSQLHHADGRVAVPHFYDEVETLTEEERTKLLPSDISDDDWQRMMGNLQEWGEAGYTKAERIGARPTLEINGIAGGYAGEGFKTVLPAKAWAKISCRLVPYQDPFVIFERIKAFIEEMTPPTVCVDVTFYDSGYPAITPIDDPAVTAAINAYARHWDNAPIYLRGGGSIPVVADFQNLLGMPVVLLGFALPDCGAHGPDENFNLAMYQRGIETVITYMESIGGLDWDA